MGTVLLNAQGDLITELQHLLGWLVVGRSQLAFWSLFRSCPARIATRSELVFESAPGVRLSENVLHDAFHAEVVAVEC